MTDRYAEIHLSRLQDQIAKLQAEVARLRDVEDAFADALARAEADFLRLSELLNEELATGCKQAASMIANVLDTPIFGKKKPHE